MFLTPPGMNARGSGFSVFSYTTLAIGNILIALLFFTIPSKPMMIWASLLSGLLVISVLIILGVPRLRVEEGWVGIASVAWTTLMAFYLVAQTHLVARGNQEEEVRLT